MKNLISLSSFFLLFFFAFNATAQLRTEAANGSVKFFNGSTFMGDLRQSASTSMYLTNRTNGSIYFKTSYGTKEALKLNSNGAAYFPYHVRLGNNNDGTAWRLGVTGSVIVRDGKLHIVQRENNNSGGLVIRNNVSSGTGRIWYNPTTGSLHLQKGTEHNDQLVLKGNGSVGISTTYVPSGYKLAVDGNIIAERVRVSLSSSWPDYVFSEKYQLMPLKELKASITENGHLPNIPDAITMEKQGIDVGEMQIKTMEKVEELTLYILQLNERLEDLEEENQALKAAKK